MRRVIVVLVLLTITCIPRPNFKPNEEKFTVRPYITKMTPMMPRGKFDMPRGKFETNGFYEINATVEARNPTNQDFILYAGCDFSEGENIFATTVTKTLVAARQIKIFKLDTPIVLPVMDHARITIHCRYETKRAKLK